MASINYDPIYHQLFPLSKDITVLSYTYNHKNLVPKTQPEKPLHSTSISRETILNIPKQDGTYQVRD